MLVITMLKPIVMMVLALSRDAMILMHATMILQPAVTMAIAIIPFRIMIARAIA
jgi:hypothetical protein